MALHEGASHRGDITTLRVALSPLGPRRHGAIEADLPSRAFFIAMPPLGASAFEGGRRGILSWKECPSVGRPHG